MDKKVCSECGTENESEYLYCKNCGAPMSTSEARPEPEFISYAATEMQGEAKPPVKNASPEINNINQDANLQNNNFNSQNTGYNPQNAGYNPPNNNFNPQFNGSNIYSAYTIDGIPADDVAHFIGAKSNNIMPKFLKMEVTRSKTSWCWPAAILGYLMGPLGAAIWFFYRKMYKIAALLVAIGLALTVVNAALTYDLTSEMSEDVFDLIMENDFEALLNGITENIPQTARYTAATLIENISSLLTCIFTGIFGYYMYKEHAVKKIKDYMQSSPDSRYYKFAIAALGGVSGGMLAVGIIVFFASEYLTTAVTLILSML